MSLIFVYGTLKKNLWNHGYLGKSKYVGDLIVDGFELYENGIPFMVRSDNPAHKVYGELYSVDDRTLAYMDHLEGHPDWYRREHVITLSGQPIEGYVYISQLSPHCEKCQINQHGAYEFYG